MLSKLPSFGGSEELLVGHATNDDAAVLRIEGSLAIVQTVDFFTPIVDDPRLFGAIAAANSVSDIYAMGARPVLGLAIAAFPTDRLPLSVLTEILTGGADKAKEAGFPIGGGHTIIDDVPKYGLAVTGVIQTDRIVRNSTAKPDDVLYLTKPIGNGILVSASRALTTPTLRNRFRRSLVPKLDDAIDWMLRLNRDAAAIMVECGVSAATDVTGYGLAGHLLEICRGSSVGAEVRVGDVPVLAGARDLLGRGFRPSGTIRNCETFRSRVEIGVSETEFTLMCDAQTSGGLLIAMPPARAAEFEARSARDGLLCAKIGKITGDAGRLRLIR